VLLDEVPWLSGMIKGIERGPVGIKLWANAILYNFGAWCAWMKTAFGTLLIK
jgi:hypothetical protein